MFGVGIYHSKAVSVATRFLVTGASGFIGRKLCRDLLLRGHWVRAATTRYAMVNSLDALLGPYVSAGIPEDGNYRNGVYEVVHVQELDGDLNAWSDACRGVDVVIHAGGRAHVEREGVRNSLRQHMTANCETTLSLARVAISRGVGRFVFVSSVHVNGPETSHGSFTELDTPMPVGPYAFSKWAAERALQLLTRDSQMELVVVRPPLVFGPEVKGNILSLLDLVAKGWALPFRGIKNARSMIGLENLIDALIVCGTHSDAVGRTFLLSEDNDISTPELLLILASQMGSSTRLYTVPRVVLRALFLIAGRRRQFDKFCGNLQADSSLIRHCTGWRPRIPMNEGLRAMAAWYAGKRAADGKPI
jgi:nucleoside-diphosphate-sugar epimerase